MCEPVTIAIAGAAIGGGIGYAATGDAKGALIGAGIGATGGYLGASAAGLGTVGAGAGGAGSVVPSLTYGGLSQIGAAGMIGSGSALAPVAVSPLMSGLGSLMSGMATIAPYVAVALIAASLIMGMKKGNRNISIQSIGLPENAPAILQQQGIGKGVTTLRHYRDFTGHWKDTARPIDAAGDFTQQRLKSLSRIFPGMMDVSDALAKQREVMYGPSSSQQAAFGNIQTYVDALYRAEGFVENLFADKMVQGYIGRKTNMSFEDFKKGWDFSTELNLTERFRLPAAHAAISNVLSTAQKAPVIGRNRKTGTATQYGPSLWDEKMGEFLGNTYRSYTTQGNRKTGQAPVTYRQVQTGWKSLKGGGRRPTWEDLSEARYNETVAKATEYYTGPDTEVGKELKKQQDFITSTPQFGSYTQFRPFQPNWTPGTPQIGLSEDAPGPDIDTLKERLTITDGYYGGMGGGGFPQTRFGVTVPRMSQRGMARQA